VRRTVEVDTMSQTYAEVSSSNVVAFFNYNDYLEIAMNQGNLAALNDVNIGDTVQIDFQ
jgi:S-adenosylmethionine hydrolase